jgi:hypothetical protein
VCPALDDETGELITLQNLNIQRNLRHLYQHLMENGYLRDLEAIDREHLSIFSDLVLDQIRAGDPAWESMVPSEVVKIIRERGLFKCA